MTAPPPGLTPAGAVSVVWPVRRWRQSLALPCVGVYDKHRFEGDETWRKERRAKRVKAKRLKAKRTRATKATRKAKTSLRKARVAKKATRRVKAKKLKPVKARKVRRAKMQRRATRKSLKSMVARGAFPGVDESPPVETPVIDALGPRDQKDGTPRRP
jgi:hypothetical protein